MPRPPPTLTTPADAGKVVGLGRDRAHLGGAGALAGIEDARLLRVFVEVGEEIVHVMENAVSGLAGPDARGKLAARLPTAVAAVHEDHGPHRVGRIGAQALPHGRQLEFAIAEIAHHVEGGQRPQQAMHHVGSRARRLGDLRARPWAAAQRIGHAQPGRGDDHLRPAVGHGEPRRHGRRGERARSRRVIDCHSHSSRRRALAEHRMLPTREISVLAVETCKTPGGMQR